jgi:hypothetical protein
MKKVIKLTESDLARIVKRVINENKNNTRYYSNRNLRRLGRTPVVMVESIDDYGPMLMTEGVLEKFKEKLESLVDKSKTFIIEKAEDIKESIENNFGKTLDEITLDDIKNKLNELIGGNSEKETVMSERFYKKNNFLFEDDGMSFADRFDRADVGNDSLGEPVKDKSRIGQRILNALQTILGVNVLSFGLLGSFLQSVIFGSFTSWAVHLIVSALAIGIIMIIRKVMAALSGNVNERYYRKYSRY